MNTAIKFLRLDRQYQNIKSEILPAIDRVLSSGKVLQGKEVEDFEGDVAGVCGADYAAATSSGTDALIFSMKALGLASGDKVAVTSLSFIASASAIVHAGGTPVFVDINDKDYLMNEAQIRALIESREIKGVVAVHLFGQMFDVEPIYALCRANGVFLVEDAAQCFGAKCRGYGPGVHSDAACVSFDPMKVIGACGSGGAVVSRRKEIRDAVARLRYHGQSAPQEYAIVGYNSQLPSVQAEILRIKLRRLKEWEMERNRVAAIYFRELSEVGDLALPLVLPDRTHVWHKFVVRTGERDALAAHLKDAGIETMAHYRKPLFAQPNMSGYSRPRYASYSVNAVVSELLSLPVYPELTDEEALYICSEIRKFYRS